MDQRFENELKKVLSERQVKTGEPMEIRRSGSAVRQIILSFRKRKKS